LETGEKIEPIDYVDTFGDQLAEYIEQAAKASSCSKEYIMMLLLTISATIIAHKRRIKVRHGWEEPPVIWGLLVGNPSCRKSVSMIPFYKALKPLNERRKADYKRLKRIYLDRVKDIKSNKENAAICNELIQALNKPILNQIVIGDTTIEGLCKAIDPNNPTCICLFRDEFYGVLKNLQTYNNNNKTPLVEGYNGNPYVINRAGKDEPILIDELLIVLAGGIQPDVLAEMLAAPDDGFPSRFLFAYSEPTKISVIEDNPNFDNGLLQQIFDKLDTKLTGKTSLSLSAKAKILFQAFIDKHFEDQQCVSGSLASSYGKMHGQALRISCMLEHLFWAVKPESSPPTEVTADTLEKTICLMDFYFKPMVGKILSECRKYKKHIPPLEKFVKHLAESKERSFNWRKLVDRGAFKQLKDKKDATINFLTERNIIRRTYLEDKSNRSENYAINPQLKDAFSEINIGITA
jgi:putative DNA primase/helicase